jgi:NADH:ubiquinone oxidoreductase subunit 2 (subunit N)
MPPAPGFIGKFTLVGAIVRHHWWGLAAIAILSSMLSTIAIARLAFHLIGPKKLPAFSLGRRAHERKVFLVVLLVPLLLAGFFANGVLDWAGKSLGFILW